MKLRLLVIGVLVLVTIAIVPALSQVYQSPKVVLQPIDASDWVPEMPLDLISENLGRYELSIPVSEQGAHKISWELWVDRYGSGQKLERLPVSGGLVSTEQDSTGKTIRARTLLSQKVSNFPEPSWVHAVTFGGWGAWAIYPIPEELQGAELVDWVYASHPITVDAGEPIPLGAYASGGKEVPSLVFSGTGVNLKDVLADFDDVYILRMRIDVEKIPNG